MPCALVTLIFDIVGSQKDCKNSHLMQKKAADAAVYLLHQ
jgi:hypothetical protein